MKLVAGEGYHSPVLQTMAWQTIACEPIWPMIVFMNKVLLETVIPICLHMVYGCFGATMADLKSCRRKHMVHKV
jgi:hypothetical protein